MENTTGATGGNTAIADAAGNEANAGNSALGAAFDSAMAKATETLTLTTERGADLYAMKQSVR